MEKLCPIQSSVYTFTDDKITNKYACGTKGTAILLTLQCDRSMPHTWSPHVTSLVVVSPVNIRKKGHYENIHVYAI